MNLTGAFSLKNIVKGFLFLVFFALFLSFYFVNQTLEFIKGSTTFSSRTEIVDRFDIPVVTLCFHPRYKPSLSGTFTSNLSPYLQPDNKQLPTGNKSVSDFLENASYKLGQDFQIELKVISKDYDDNISQEALSLTMGTNEPHFLKPYLSTVQTLTNGLCHRIESPVKIAPSGYLVLRVKLSKELDILDLPTKLDVY